MESRFISTAPGVSTFFPTEFYTGLAVNNLLLWMKGTLVGNQIAYFCFTAIAEISIRALLTKAAAWMVARAGFGSGITPL